MTMVVAKRRVGTLVVAGLESADVHGDDGQRVTTCSVSTVGGQAKISCSFMASGPFAGSRGSGRLLRAEVFVRSRPMLAASGDSCVLERAA